MGGSPGTHQNAGVRMVGFVRKSVHVLIVIYYTTDRSPPEELNTTEINLYADRYILTFPTPLGLFVRLCFCCEVPTVILPQDFR